MAEQRYIMAIDEGTTSTRAVLVDKSGAVVGSAQKEFSQYFPASGWVEQDPNEIWNAVQAVIAGALIDSGLHPDTVAAIGITNQRETTVIWDKETGRPIYNAIVWQSRQTEDIADQLIAAGYRDTIHEKTGLIIDPYFSATKIRWILDHVAGAQERAEKGELLFGTIDSWLVWKLTDGRVHVTDYTNASRTMLYNIHELAWDQDILELLHIPEVMLPEVKSNSEIYGYTQTYHFYGGKVPIAGMAGDQQAALFGQLAFEPGMVKNTYGTGAFVIMNIGEEPTLSDNHLLTSIGYGLNGTIHYALEGSIFVAGSAIQWLRDQMRLIESAPASEVAARKASGNDDTYVVPAFTGLGAPYWDSAARGAIFGLTRATTREDLVKATLQSLAYQTRDVIETMKQDSEIAIPVLKADGGAANNDWLMQFQADILDTEVYRPASTETTVLGAAYLAGLAVGFWPDTDALQNLQRGGDTFRPQMSPAKRKNLYAGWKEAVKATRTFKHRTLKEE